MSERDEALRAIADTVLPVHSRDGKVATMGHLMASLTLDALAAAGYTVTRLVPTGWVWSESEQAAFYGSSGAGDDEPLYRRGEGSTERFYGCSLGDECDDTLCTDHDEGSTDD